MGAARQMRQGGYLLADVRRDRFPGTQIQSAFGAARPGVGRIGEASKRDHPVHGMNNDCLGC
jgi:hypothetical protein